MPKLSSVASDLRLLQPFWAEDISRIVLPNGLVLLLKADRSAALASVQVWVKTGSVHEGARLGAGLSHYLEHMLFKGTTHRAGREISATVQAHGGYINAYTTFDRTVYYIDLPSEHTEVAIELLADAVLHSTLPADETAREKDVILREIAMTRDEPDTRLWDALFTTSFRVHPYAQPIIGHRDVFSEVSRGDLLEYYQERYVPNNLVVTIVGDIDLAATEAAVARHFGVASRRPMAPVYVPDEPTQLAARESHRFEDVEITRAALGWQIPGLTHPDAPLLDLISMILGSGESSILWQEIRERARLVHSIDASSWNPGSSGLFCIGFTGDGDKRNAAIAKIHRVIERCRVKGFTAAQIKKAVRQLVVGEISSRKTMSGQASRLGSAEVVVGDLRYSKAYFDQLSAATPAQLRTVLRRYLVPEHLTTVSLNPREKVPTLAVSRNVASGIPDFSEIKLANGARLLLQHEDRLPNIHLRLLMQGGPLFENPAERGATALLATMLTKDTASRSSEQVAQYIEEVGGSFYPVSGNNSIGLGLEVLTPDLDRALSILEEASLSPRFLPSSFAVERDAQLAGLQEDLDDVVTLARKNLRAKFFGQHAMRLDAHGDEAGVKALSPASLAQLHRRLAVGPNVVLAVAGSFRDAKLLPRLRAFLSKFPAAAAPEIPRTDFIFPAAVGDYIEIVPREQAVVLQAFPGPAVNAVDSYIAEVADELFSGMASRLFERVREELGLAYFVRSGRITGLDTGMFYFMAGTQPGREGDVLAEIDREIRRVQAGDISAEEIGRCRTRLKAARRQSLQTNASRAMQAALNALQGQPINDWKNYDGRVDGVTVADLAEFARQRFQVARRTQLVVRPEAKVTAAVA